MFMHSPETTVIVCILDNVASCSSSSYECGYYFVIFKFDPWLGRVRDFVVSVIVIELIKSNWMLINWLMNMCYSGLIFACVRAIFGMCNFLLFFIYGFVPHVYIIYKYRVYYTYVHVLHRLKIPAWKILQIKFFHYENFLLPTRSGLWDYFNFKWFLYLINFDYNIS